MFFSSNKAGSPLGKIGSTNRYTDKFHMSKTTRYVQCVRSAAKIRMDIEIELISLQAYSRFIDFTSLLVSNALKLSPINMLF